MVEYLSPLDAGFLDAEDEERHASLAIASVVIAEGPAPSHEDFLNLVRTRLPMIPRYRHRVRTVPFDLGRPMWVDDAGFDLEFHVRRTALPAPGDDAALCRLVGRVMSQRLDRNRPLWECWVIEGLASGRWAVLVKVHHCMVDGVSGIQLLGALLTDTQTPPGTREATAESDWLPDAGPNTCELMLRAIGSVLTTPAEQVRLAVRALGAPWVLLGEIGQTGRGLFELIRALVPASRSSLIGPIGQHRRYGLVRASLTDVVAVSKAFDVTVNDVVLATVSGALRALLLHRGESPARDSVRALVPVSIRAKGAEGILDNQISMMLPFLPVDIADPLERLQAVHAHLGALKASNEAQAGAALTTLARHEPFAPISWAVRLAASIPQRTVVAVTTNVPGPPQPLCVVGRPILEILPYVPIGLRMRTGVAALTYCDQLTFGVTLDYDSTPEVELLSRAIDDGLCQLSAAARAVKVPAPAASPVRRAARKKTASAGTRRMTAKSDSIVAASGRSQPARTSRATSGPSRPKVQADTNHHPDRQS